MMVSNSFHGSFIEVSRVFQGVSKKFQSGSHKDKHRGTSGAEEGFSSIGRFRKITLFGIF